MPVVSAGSHRPIEAVAAWFRGQSELITRLGRVVRQAFDEVLDGQRTGRFDVQDLAKVEKTYIGTKVEILLQAEFDLERGRAMDVLVAGYEVDVKWSATFGGWMIPSEAISQLCLCLWGSDKTSMFSVGLVQADDELLKAGENKDGKRRLTGGGLTSIEWLVRDGSLPENVLLHLPELTRERIFAYSSGQRRVNELFRLVQDRLVSRESVVTVAKQVDGPKRVRDARKALARDGIMILGHQDRHPELARSLDLPVPRKGEWISTQVADGPISPSY